MVDRHLPPMKQLDYRRWQSAEQKRLNQLDSDIRVIERLLLVLTFAMAVFAMAVMVRVFFS